jgi:hypothetical protein
MGEMEAIPVLLDDIGSDGSVSRSGLNVEPKTGGVYEWMTDGAQGDIVGGGGGVFGEVAGKMVRVIDEVAVASDDEEEEGNNFYENVAEATKGKRILPAVSQSPK